MQQVYFDRARKFYYPGTKKDGIPKIRKRKKRCIPTTTNNQTLAQSCPKFGITSADYDTSTAWMADWNSLNFKITVSTAPLGDKLWQLFMSECESQLLCCSFLCAQAPVETTNNPMRTYTTRCRTENYELWAISAKNCACFSIIDRSFIENKHNVKQY